MKNIGLLVFAAASVIFGEIATCEAHYPFWIGKHPEPMTTGHWGYRPDWRTADWSADVKGYSFRRKTQAASLWWADLCGKRDCPAWQAELEYIPDNPICTRGMCRPKPCDGQPAPGH
jgi:hypothetical protein